MGIEQPFTFGCDKSMMILDPLPLGFQTYALATAPLSQPAQPALRAEGPTPQPLPAWLTRTEGAVNHPYFQTPTILARRKSDEVEIIDGDDDDDEDDEDIRPVSPPVPRAGEGIPLHIVIDDRPPPPGWRTPQRREDSQGDGRREGGIITITPDDDPTKVDFTI